MEKCDCDWQASNRYGITAVHDPVETQVRRNHAFGRYIAPATRKTVAQVLRQRVADEALDFQFQDLNLPKNPSLDEIVDLILGSAGQ